MLSFGLYVMAYFLSCRGRGECCVMHEFEKDNIKKSRRIKNRFINMWRTVI